MFKGVRPGSGFYPVEYDLEGPFVWTRGTFNVGRESVRQALELRACYYGDEGKLILVDSAGQSITTLHKGWNTYLIEPPDTSGTLTFKIDQVIEAEGDSRELGIMIRAMGAIEPSRVEGLRQSIANRGLNDREFLEGRTVLDSVPPGLRINLETRCNIKPSCVYCEWEWAKSAETVSGYFTQKDITRLGQFYTQAEKVVDCSYGEPLLNPELRAIVSDLDAAGKHFEMTTNGILLNERKQNFFLGKDVTLYVSVDASNPLTYQRMRTNKFDEVIENLRALCGRKKIYDNLPTVVVSFIALTSNQNEFPDYVKLMKRIGVDAIKVRTLFSEGLISSENRSALKRGFDYNAEKLSFLEFQTFSKWARELAAQNSIILVIDHEFGDQDSRGPLCAEPWKTLYVLNRGILPCCYTKEAFGSLEPAPPLALSEHVAEVFNNRRFQEIRSALAQGYFPDFCLRSPSCPIVASNRRGDATRSIS